MNVIDKAADEAKRWALVVLLVLVGVLGYFVSSLNGSVDGIQGSVGRIEQSSSRTEAVANELVEFVHEIQAQQPSSGSGQTQQAVKVILDVLCASSDPVRVEACAALTEPGG